jgi:hypothetical protein
MEERMDYRSNAFRVLHVAGGAWRVQAAYKWLRALGRRPSRQLPRAWHNYRALSRANAARRANEDIDLGIFFSFSVLAFSLFAIERAAAIVGFGA